MGSRRVLVVTRPDIMVRNGVVRSVCDQLTKAGVSVQLVDHLPTSSFGKWEALCVNSDVELVLVLGGDGTILGAAELVKGTHIPILGVNMGHVGFLAEFEEFQVREAIERVIAHDYQIEERTLADVKAYLPGVDQPLHDWALNEVTIEKADRGKMVELGVKIDGTEVNTCLADGVVISTPTGSTAYAFSAGGPVIFPGVECLELVPVAAHALFARPIVIGPHSQFSIDILSDSISEGWVACDGRRAAPLPRGTRVEVSTCKDRLRLAHLSEVPFSKRLVSKFNLPVNGWRNAHLGKNKREYARVPHEDEKK
jgi:NAD+ kinase